MSSEQPTPTAIQQVISLLKEAKEQSEKLLADQSQNSLQLAVTFDLNKLINRLSYMSGTPIAHNQREVMDFPPVTNFMGEEIVRAEAITEEVLQPKEDAKKIYLAKVESLEGVFHELSNEDILHMYTTPEDVMVLRGVAKRAGVEDYKEKELTLEFVEEIRTGLAAKSQNKQTEADIDKVTADLSEEETAKQQQIQSWEDELKAEKDKEEVLNKDIEKVKADIASAKPKDKPALEAKEKQLQADLNTCLEKQLWLEDQLKPHVQE